MIHDDHRAYHAVAAIAFAAAIGTYAVLDQVILPALLKRDARVAILVLASIGAYTLFYYVFIFLFATRFFWFVNPLSRLSGEWHQVFTIGEGRSPGYRHGTVIVDSNMNGIVLSASTYRPDGSYSSSWQSHSVHVDTLRLEIVYASQGLGRGDTTGLMRFMIEDRKFTRLTGTYSDAAPALHMGEIRLYRSFDEAKQFQQELMSKVNNAPS